MTEEQNRHCIICTKVRSIRQRENWQCSHVDCPLRLPDVSGPDNLEPGPRAGTYIVRPTNKE